jgi:RNA polymerase sigma factor (sigma-70 family)
MAQHEPTLDPQELLTQLPFVRGLARELLKGSAAADDVAQEAAVAALAGAHANAPMRGALRPWLVGVTRNLARMFRRGEQRRGARERAAAVNEALPSAVDQSVRFEALRRVVLAMERLDAGDRTLLVRRFYDEWPPRRIAAELRVPVDTVRTRLARALERLRRELIDGGGRDGGRQLPALLVALVAPPPSLSPNAPWIGATPPVGKGVVLMTAKMKISAAVVVVAIAAAGVAIWPRDAKRARAADVGTRTDATTAATAGAKEAISATRVEAAPAKARPVTAKRRVVALHGRLIAQAGELERWSTSLTVTASIESGRDGQILAPPAPERLRASVAVARDGTFSSELEFDDRTPRLTRLTLTGADPAFASFRRWFAVPYGTAPRLEWNLDIHVFEAACVRGRVVDESGRGVADGAVSAFAVAGGTATLLGETTVDGDGRFKLGVSPPGACCLVASQRRSGPELKNLDATRATRPLLLPVVVELTADPMRESDLGELVLRSGVSIRGRVEWVTHGPVAGAIVDAIPVRETAPPDGDDGKAIPRPFTNSRLTRPLVLPSGQLTRVSTVTDDLGAFELSGLLPGPTRILVRCLPDGLFYPDGAFHPKNWKGRPPEQVDAPANDVLLRVDGAIVQFEVKCAGKPIEGAEVFAGTGGSGWRAIGDGKEITGPDGRLSSFLSAAVEGSYISNAEGYRSARGTFTTPAAGERMLVPIELEPKKSMPALVVHLVDEQGVPITVAGIQLESLPDRTIRGEQEISVYGGERLAPDGRFVVNDVNPGDHRLRVAPGGRFAAGDGCYAELSRDVTIRQGAVETLELIAIAAGRLRVAARDALGRFLPAHFSLRDEAGRPIDAGPLDLEEDANGGAVSLRTHNGLATNDFSRIDPALPPGHYVATFTLAGFEAQSVPVEIKPLQPTDVEVVLAPAR